MSDVYHNEDQLLGYGKAVSKTMAEGKSTYKDFERIGSIIYLSIEDLHLVLGISPKMVEHFQNSSPNS